MTNINKRLHGSRQQHILAEFFTNTAYFPVINVLLEVLLANSFLLFMKLDFYVLLSACLIQSYFLGNQKYIGHPRPFLGNLIAPSLYTIVEISFDGLAFFETPNHIAYWGFAIVIAVTQALQLHYHRIAGLFTVLEGIGKANIILIMYWIYEAIDEQKYYTARDFFNDGGHLFLALTLNLIGLMMGIAHRNNEIFLNLLRQTSEQFKRYSEWLLGKNILAMAIADPTSLTLNRRERTVLFMDIRGFTHWSESQPPEKVVEMINQYCETAESCWEKSNAIKVKLTGDEIMIVFQTPQHALAVAKKLRTDINVLLANYNLGVGIGIHIGPLVEGLIGSQKMKTYDILGDSVNTAKRLCDFAKSGEILISENVYTVLSPPTKMQQAIQVKGKTMPIQVFTL